MLLLSIAVMFCITDVHDVFVVLIYLIDDVTIKQDFYILFLLFAFGLRCVLCICCRLVVIMSFVKLIMLMIGFFQQEDFDDIVF